MSYLTFIRVLFIVMTGLVLLLFHWLGDASQKISLIMLGFVITLGMSHGSLDWLVAKKWGARGGWRANIIFLLCYLTIVSITLSLWWLFPAASLLIFLLMSALHFADDWQAEINHFSQQFVVGLATVSVPAIAFGQDVLAIFTLLIPAKQAALATQLLQIIAYASLLWSGLLAVRWGKRTPGISAEILALMLAGILLPPIIYFSLYFCLLHATKHWFRLRVLGVYQHIQEALWSAVWPTVFCLLVGLWACYAFSAGSFSNAFIRTVFIGLAALTVPHWLLLKIYPLLMPTTVYGYKKAA